MSKRSRIENSTEKVRKNKKTKRSLLVIFLVFIVIPLLLPEYNLHFIKPVKRRMSPQVTSRYVAGPKGKTLTTMKGGRLVNTKGVLTALTRIL